MDALNQRMLRFTARIFVSVVAVVSTLFGYNRTQTRPLQPVSEWQEHYSRTSQVSGTTIRGIMSGDQEARATPGIVSLRLPSSGAQSICVKVVSRDGRFHASATFRPTPRTSGDINLEGPRNRRIRRYSTKDLVVLAEAGLSCDDRQRRQIPAVWGRRYQTGDVYIYINARQYTSIAWRGQGGEQIREMCREIEDFANVTYNRVCRLRSETLPARAQLFVDRQGADGSISQDGIILEYAQ